jgi:hypothetical protein
VQAERYAWSRPALIVVNGADSLSTVNSGIVKWQILRKSESRPFPAPKSKMRPLTGAAVNYVLIALCILLRFAPHPPDLSPLFGALLFSGCRLPAKQSLWFPLAMIAITDLALTPMIYHTQIGVSQLVTWLAFSIVIVCGWLLRETVNFSRLAGAAILAPTAFWIVANFGVWITGSMYPRSLPGLAACYVAALPFYKNALVSTIAVTVLLFATEETIRRVGAFKLGESTRTS